MQVQQGLTFEDVTLMPSKLVCNLDEVCLRTNITHKISINVPVIGCFESINDVRTGASTAIDISRQGGIGVINCDRSIEDQVTEVDKVKRSQHGLITDPFYLSPNNYIYEAEDIMSKYKISGVPVCEGRKLVGIITNRDLKFETNKEKKIYELMTHDNLITAPVGTDFEEAKLILLRNKVEKLPIVDKNFHLKGLFTTKDIDKSIKYPNASTDKAGRLRVGALISCGDDYLERAQELRKSKVDVVIFDAVYAYSDLFFKKFNNLKKTFGDDLEIIVGNVATPDAVLELVNLGADAIKVGFNNYALGVGIPELTVICDCKSTAAKYGVPIISNCSTSNSGSVLKALAAGANACVINNASFNNRRNSIHSSYEDYSNHVKENMGYLSNDLRLGLYYCGSSSVTELQKRAIFIKCT
jgi:IMP dehydrogenase